MSTAYNNPGEGPHIGTAVFLDSGGNLPATGIDLSSLVVPAALGLALYVTIRLLIIGGRIALNMWAFRGTDWEDWNR